MADRKERNLEPDNKQKVPFKNGCVRSPITIGGKKENRKWLWGGGVGFSKNVEVSVEGEKPKDHFNQKA